MRAFKYDLPKNTKGPRRVDISSITMRETNGDDERLAGANAEAKGDKEQVGVELVRLAVVKVNGVKVSQPYNAMDSWNERTRKFALWAYNEINGTTLEEKEAFLSSATEDLEEIVSPLLAAVGDND